MSAAKADEEKIRNLAFYDTLTGLPNRRLLWERLRQALISSIRSGSKHALLFVDLDGFKSLNDTLGHHIGDLLLQETARRISGCVREVDTVARLGGDEFVVILEDLSQIAEIAAAQARTVGGKILAAIDQPFLLEGRECHTTSSMGITVFGNQNESTNEVLQQADIAMYQAKAAGRNAMFFFAPALQASVNARVALERDLAGGDPRQSVFAVLSAAAGSRAADRRGSADPLEPPDAGHRGTAGFCSPGGRDRPDLSDGQLGDWKPPACRLRRGPGAKKARISQSR